MARRAGGRSPVLHARRQVRDAGTAIETEDLDTGRTAALERTQHDATAAGVLDDVRADLGDRQRNLAAVDRRETERSCKLARRAPGAADLAALLDEVKLRAHGAGTVPAVIASAPSGSASPHWALTGF